MKLLLLLEMVQGVGHLVAVINGIAGLWSKDTQSRFIRVRVVGCFPRVIAKTLGASGHDVAKIYVGVGV